MIIPICSVCHTEIKTHEERKSYVHTCDGCGKKNTIEGRTVALSTMRCKCGVIIINEGKEGWIYHPYKDEQYGERKEMQSMQQFGGTVG